MKQCGYGYYIDIRHDNRGRVGIVESCKFYQSFTNKSADLIFAIDSSGNIIEPYYIDVINGFIPLRNKIDLTNEGIKTFLNSHKATFGVLGSFVAIVDAKVKFDLNTKELVKNNISFYLPKTIIEMENYTDNKGNILPVMITQRCSNKDSFLTRSVNPTIIQMYETKVLNFLTYDIIKDKESYLRARLGI